MLWRERDFLTRARFALLQYQKDRPHQVAVDTETNGLDFYATPFCVTVAWRRPSGMYTGHYFELNSDEEIEACLRCILGGAAVLVFHNAKFDLQKLLLVGLLNGGDLRPGELDDTEALAHLLDEHRVKRLKTLAQDLLGEETDEKVAIDRAIDVVKKERGLRKKAEVSYDMLPREVIIPYAIKDAEFTIRLYDLLSPQVAAYPDLSELYHRERRLTLTLLRMETRGMGVDVEYTRDKAREYSTRALAKEMLIRDITGDEGFNPNSPKQLVEAFQTLGIELPKTNKETLRELDHPLAKAVLELRTLRKMHSTYLLAMLHEQRGGTIHPSFRQHGTKTGRMSSGGQEAD